MLSISKFIRISLVFTNFAEILKKLTLTVGFSLFLLLFRIFGNHWSEKIFR